MVSPPRPLGHTAHVTVKVGTTRSRGHVTETDVHNSMSTTPMVVLLDEYPQVLFNRKSVHHFNGYQWTMEIRKV